MSLHDAAMSSALSMYDAPNQESSSSGNTLDPGNIGATKKLARGISRATENADIVEHARMKLGLGSIDTPEFTFSLPDLSIYPGKILMSIIKILINRTLNFVHMLKLAMFIIVCVYILIMLLTIKHHFIYHLLHKIFMPILKLARCIFFI